MFVYLLIAKRWRGRRNYYWKAKDRAEKWYQWEQWRARRTRACLWCKTCYHDLCPCYSVYGCRRSYYQFCYILYQERWILVRILFQLGFFIICKSLFFKFYEDYLSWDLSHLHFVILIFLEICSNLIWSTCMLIYWI